MRKFYKTVIRVEVLSEDPVSFGETLSGVDYAITEGDCSGKVKVVSQKTITPKQAAKELIKHGSDPAFFQLTETGEEVNS
jgi:hypothetical protein